MSALMASRGPDDLGEYRDPEADVSLGARRLSILDLEGGHQPMSHADGRLWVVFNGEIYNAPELRRRLEAKGHRFVSAHSDTEVLLHLYDEQQEDMLEGLNGMFAFVIYDRRRQRLFGARDRFGIKPLYYANTPTVFAFASELKCLLAVPTVSRELDPSSVFHYMSLKYLPGEASIFQEVKRLPPAHWFSYDLRTGALTIRRFWQLRFEPDERASVEQWCDRIQDGLRQAVGRWTLSDVPVGCSLSGGIDSSTLVGILATSGVSPIRTYSLGFNEGHEQPFSELARAREVAKHWGTQHHELVLSADELLNDLLRMVWVLDEPYGGGLPSWYVFRFMRRDVKVALTGTGGDELFGNYGKFRWLEANPLVRFLQATREHAADRLLRRQIAPPAYALSRGRDDFRKYYFDRFYYLSDDVKRSRVFGNWTDGVRDSGDLLREWYEGVTAPTARDKVASLDISTQLAEEFLLMTDRFSMAHGVEARVPYLDHEFVELIFQIPARLRTRPSALKYLFKRSVSDLLPAELLKAPKRGFVLPTAFWLRGKLRPLVERLLHPQRLRRQGIFQPMFYEQFVQPHLEGRMNAADQVWTALMFQLWHVVFVEQGGRQAPAYDWQEVAAG